MIYKLAFLLWILSFSTSFADNVALNNNQQMRAQSLYKKIRCPTCIAQSISDSSSIASTQIRSYIDRRIYEGLNDEQIIQNLSSYYGDSILYSNVFKSENLTLWALPLIFLAYILYWLIKNNILAEIF